MLSIEHFVLCSQPCLATERQCPVLLQLCEPEIFGLPDGPSHAMSLARSGSRRWMECSLSQKGNERDMPRESRHLRRASVGRRGSAFSLASRSQPKQHFDFHEERVKLKRSSIGAWHAQVSSDRGPHCTFGKMSVREWGKLLQVHPEYHLKQFGSSIKDSDGGPFIPASPIRHNSPLPTPKDAWCAPHTLRVTAYA